MGKKLIKPCEQRGSVIDKIVECFGNQVLGIYEGAIRIETMDDNGEIHQFSIKTTKNKTIIDECEATPYVPIAELTANYEKLVAEREAELALKEKKKQSKKK